MVSPVSSFLDPCLDRLLFIPCGSASPIGKSGGLAIGAALCVWTKMTLQLRSLVILKTSVW